MPAWETFAYLNVRERPRVQWNDFPSDFADLQNAMATIPTVAPRAEVVWKILAAILHLGNAKFIGNGEDDAYFDAGPAIGVAASLLGCVAEQQRLLCDGGGQLAASANEVGGGLSAGFHAACLHDESLHRPRVSVLLANLGRNEKSCAPAYTSTCVMG